MTSKTKNDSCRAMRLCFSFVLVMLMATLAQSRQFHNGKITSFGSHKKPFGTEASLISRISIAESLRGGATVDEEDKSDEEVESDEEEEEEVSLIRMKSIFDL